MPTKEKAQELFVENYELINTAATLLWEHYDELDCLVSDGEDMVNMYSHGRKEDDFPYTQTSLTSEEKSAIFAAWRLLGTNGLQVTYHMSLPEQAPVIAVHCGYDKIGRAFGYYYIRPVETSVNDSAQDTVEKRIACNNYNNANSYVEWQPLDYDYWYQGTTKMELYRYMQ